MNRWQVLSTLQEIRRNVLHDLQSREEKLNPFHQFVLHGMSNVSLLFDFLMTRVSRKTNVTDVVSRAS